jgi:hypothetical protein
MDLKEMGWEDMDLSHVVQGSDYRRSLGKGVENLRVP